MFRTLRRWFSDAETKKLAEEVDQLLHRVADLGIKCESMQLRVDRHMHKLQMRDLRQRERDTGITDEDRRILDEIRARSGGNGGYPQDDLDLR